MAELVREWRDSMRDETRRCLETLGDPALVTGEVQTPLTPAQEQAQVGQRTKTYKWFVANEREPYNRQNLKALERNGFEIPKL